MASPAMASTGRQMDRMVENIKAVESMKVFDYSHGGGKSPH